MNLIYLHTHDTGRYLQPYGQAVPTPRLQEFAESATLFRNNYCCGPTCSPSRGAMLTGMYPHSNGLMGLAHRGFAIADYGWHLAQFLGENGYETSLCGMQHEAEDENDIGYQHVNIASKEKAKNATEWDERNGDFAIEFLRGGHDRPFFLSYGLEHTHRPFTEFDEDIRAGYGGVPGPLPDEPAIREDFAGFATSARRADACIGRVLDAITELDLWKDTVVLYTTDHGIAFPFMKCQLFDSGIGVAMMLRYPGNPMKGQVVNALTSHLDVFPTLCELLSLPRPERLQGVSLLPLLRQEAENVREEIVAESIYHAAYEPQIAVRTQRYKYIRHFDPGQTRPALPNIDASPSKDFLLAQGLAGLEIDQEQLYDLLFDPNERRNLRDDPAYADILADMRGRLQKYMEDTRHPLLEGSVPLPRGAFVMKPHVLDPESTDPADRIVG